METIEVWCGVSGTGSYFSIEINRCARVKALMDAIYKHERLDQTRSGDEWYSVGQLKLFVAQHEGGEWVAEDLDLQAFLEGGVDTSQFTRMLKRNKLSVYFGTEGLPEHAIHVLVALPSTMRENNNEQPPQRKRNRLTFSKMNSTRLKTVLTHINARIEEAESSSSDEEEEAQADGNGYGVDDVNPFEWLTTECNKTGEEFELNEVQQRERYLSYVETNLRETLTTKKLCVKRTESGQAPIVAIIGDTELSGYPDLMILSKRAMSSQSALRKLKGVRMVIEAKREVHSDDEPQVSSQLIALDCVVRDPVMALLTDFRSVWNFFWIQGTDNDGKNVIRNVTVTTPKDGFEVIRAHLMSPAGVERIRLPCIPRGVKRRKLVHIDTLNSTENQARGQADDVEWYRVWAIVHGCFCYLRLCQIHSLRPPGLKIPGQSSSILLHVHSRRPKQQTI